jgi:hypothetical protein
MAFSARRSSASDDDARVLKATLPLDKMVRTSEKPALSKQCFNAGILAFIGLTPRRKATYRGMVQVRFAEEQRGGAIL